MSGAREFRGEIRDRRLAATHRAVVGRLYCVVDDRAMDEYDAQRSAFGQTGVDNAPSLIP